MPITALPPAPLPTDTPPEFNTKSFNLVAALDTFVTETNTIQADVNTKATTATTQAGIATTKASEASASSSTAAAQATLATTNGAAQVALATTQANNASSSASTATTQAGIATTQAGIATTQAGIATTQASEATTQANRAYSEAERAEAAADSISSGPVTSVNTKTGVVTLSPIDIAPAATTLEMQTGTEVDYRSMSPALVSQSIASLAKSKILRSVRTSNTALTVTDNAKFIDITSGTFTQTFTAAATLGEGWWCYIRNSGTGDITLGPDAAEMIDDLVSYVMYPGEVRLVQCDGAALQSIVLNSFYKVFTTSGNFVKPPGYVTFSGILWGGGGSGVAGCKAYGEFSSRGGASSSVAIFDIVSTKLLQLEPVVIGAGGASQTVNANAANFSSVLSGLVGGSSTFIDITAQGGAGGAFENDAAINGNAATSVIYVGKAAELAGQSSNGGSGGNSVVPANPYAPGCGGGALNPLNNPATARLGGVSKYAGSGGNSVALFTSTDEILNAVGLSGDAPGGGGGCGTAHSVNFAQFKLSATSGAGGRGELQIRGII